ncbi:MAG: 5'-deoxynucleotidase [Clostridiales bacterium]|nr:5'-deoxynucleotidase [Clostridiales bacterium]
MSNFFAMLSRMKLINRWSLMRSSLKENIAEHSYSVAVTAHAICIIGNEKFARNYDAQRCAALALYHDSTEILTGDMPTPVKYYNSKIKDSYKEIEGIAANRLIEMLPEELQKYYRPFFFKDKKDEELWAIVKAADKIDALIKCIEETRAGNREFELALAQQQKIIDSIDLPEVQYFVNEFLGAYYLTLDEHTRGAQK